MSRHDKTGTVSPLDYHHLMVAMRQLDGLVPKVITLRGYMREADLFSYRHQEERLEWSDAAYTTHLQARIESLIMPCFGTTPLGNVDTIVLPAERGGERAPHSYERPWGWLIERLSPEVAIYQVRIPRNGASNWLERFSSLTYGTLSNESPV